MLECHDGLLYQLVDLGLLQLLELQRIVAFSPVELGLLELLLCLQVKGYGFVEAHLALLLYRSRFLLSCSPS